MLSIIAKILNYIHKKDNTMEVRNASAPMIEQKENKQAKAVVPTEASAIPHRFEIEIYEADYSGSDPNGNPVAKWKKLKYDNDIIIECSSKKELDELQQNYAMCDQRFQIVKDLGPVYQPKQLPVQNVEVKPIENKKTEDSSEKLEANDKSNDIVENNASNDAVLFPGKIDESSSLITNVQKQKTKPKIVTIGDIQLKYDGDKIYQKQWVKLNSTEASMLRLVNDNNNKFVNIQGKHFEMKKWVLVEQTSTDENDSLDFN